MVGGGRKISKFFKSHFFILILSIVLGIFLAGFIKAFLRDWQIKKEINQLEDIKKELEEKKIKTLDYLKEIESKDFAEKEARLHYGLAKNGEGLVIITEETKKINDTAENLRKMETEKEEKPNFKKWWFYFFK